MDKLAEIHQKLEAIQTELEAKQAVAKSNREAAIALCHFVSDTIRTIEPDKIDSHWYGSYDNSGVADYPNVTIHASHRPTHTTLATWRINTGGQYPPPTITTDDIVNAVLEGLNKVQLTDW